ncbi:MAG: glutamine synthetase family protein, partial [Actinomycetota bacterium]
ILGNLKSLNITDEELAESLKTGSSIDGSSIQGFARIQESDMVVKPDPATFQIFPWNSSDYVSARMFCDVLNKDGTPYEGDPRYVLKKMMKKASDMGFDAYFGPELEYYYFKDSTSTEILDNGTYFDMVPRELIKNLRQETALALRKMGINVRYSHHEVGPSQHELDIRYGNALNMADDVMTSRLVVKEIALHNNIYATFMPKPIYGQAGSGMHVHQSLFKGKENAFFDTAGEHGLSPTAYGYIAGLLKHASEITLVLCQWVNSYKRLVSGYEAPVYICWGQVNRSALVRVPAIDPGNKNAARVEMRNPDPACNPYLAFSVMLAAGLKGIKEGYKLPKPVSDNIYEMSEDKRNQTGIPVLPEDLNEAIKAMEKSALLKEALGDAVFTWFIKNKKLEWEDFRNRVSSYELERYLPTL